MASNNVTTEVRGIPVTIDTANLGRLSNIRLFGKMRSADVDDFDKTMAAIELGERVFGGEQLDNVCRSLDESGDPFVTDLVDFMFEAFAAAAGGDPKN